MFAAEPKMAKRWAKHTKDFKTLPERVGDDTEKKGLFVMDAIAGLAKVAADNGGIEKLAADTQVSPELIVSLAKKVNLTPSQFVKAAYDDPQDYVNFLKVASGAATRGEMVKFATMGGLGRRIVDAMKASVKGTEATGYVGKKMQNNLGPLAKTQAGRVGMGATAAAGGGYVGGKATGLIGGGKGAPEQAGPHEQAVNAQTGNAGVGGMAAGGAAAAGGMNPAQQGQQQAPVQNNGPAPNPQQGGGGLSQGAKAGIAGAGVGLGALGVGAMMRKRKQKQMGKTAADVAKDVLKQAILTKIASGFRKNAADTFVGYLDVVAAKMPTLEKTAQVRKLQAAVIEGKPLSHAIKLAYPLLNGEQRGILATKLVKAAAEFGKKKDQPFKVQSRMSSTCAPGDASKTMQKMGSEKRAKALIQTVMKNRGAAGLGVAGLGLAGAGAMGGAAAKTVQGKPNPQQGGRTPMGTLNNALGPK